MRATRGFCKTTRFKRCPGSVEPQSLVLIRDPIMCRHPNSKLAAQRRPSARKWYIKRSKHGFGGLNYPGFESVSSSNHWPINYEVWISVQMPSGEPATRSVSCRFFSCNTAEYIQANGRGVCTMRKFMFQFTQNLLIANRSHVPIRSRSTYVKLEEV
jgi:hypothetical protein